MDSCKNNSPYFFIADSPSRSESFSPIDFDLIGVLAGYQECPFNPPHQNAVWGPLIRDYYVIYYITKGRGIITLNNVEHEFHESQLFITFPGVLITEYTENPDPWEYHWIYVKSSYLSRFFRMVGISEDHPCFNGTVPQEILPIFKKLASLNSTYKPSSVFDRVTLVSQFFNILFSQTEKIANSSEFKQSTNEYIAQSLRYFDLNYNNVSVNQVAEALGLTRSYFSTLFKRHMNMSPQEYLIRLRIKKACEFLIVPDATITSVAYSVGYDQFAFSRIFKKIMGISPTEYQQQNR